jgi:predicted nucleic acid-binding protein
MYLLDSNIPLEVLLKQEKANEVKEFLNSYEHKLLYLTDFSLYSIGIHLTKKGKSDDFWSFIKDLFIESSFNLLRLNLTEIKDVIYNSKSYNLDFDDAYQLTCVQKYNLKLVSFDTDFDRSPVKRFEPKDLLK